MSMMSNGGFSEVINPEVIKKVVGEELYSSWLKATEGIDGEMLKSVVEFDEEPDPDGSGLEAIEISRKIKEVFEAKTNLSIHLEYLGEEAESDSIDTEELFWELNTDQLWVKSEAFLALEKRYEEAVSREFYSIFC